MNDNRIKDAIDARLGALEYTKPFIAGDYCANRHAKAYKIPFKRIIATAAVLCCVTTVSLGVMAAAVPQIGNLFSLLGGKITSFLQPINDECRSNGVQLKLLAAMHDDDAVVIYLTLTDELGSRLSKDLELYDLKVSGIEFPSWQVMSFDEVSSTATVCITGSGGEALDKQKMNISLSTILDKYEYTDAVDLQLTAADIASANLKPELYFPAIKQMTYTGESGTLVERSNKGVLPCLKPDKYSMPINGYDWSYFSGIGIVGDELHVQQNPNDEIGLYNKLNLYLGDADGNRLDNETVQLGLGDSSTVGYHTTNEYCEDVFKLPHDMPLENIKLMADVDTYQELVRGKWDASFTLSTATAQKRASCIINMNPWEITEVRVSPIGVTIIGQGQMYDYSLSPEIVVTRHDGSELNYCSSSCISQTASDGTEQIVIKSIFSAPISVEDIASVSINGINTPLE